MYAIIFDMDADTLPNAYSEIQRVLARHSLTRQQGNVYFGSTQVNAVTCELAAMDLSSSLPWFAISVRDIRMLRIEEQYDLSPAVRQAAPTTLE